MWSFVTENWSTIKDVAAAAAPVLAALGLHHHARRWWKAWRERRKERRVYRLNEDAERAEWYRSVYQELIVDAGAAERMTENTLHNLTVQQACAHTDRRIPFFLAGWERVKVGRLN